MNTVCHIPRSILKTAPLVLLAISLLSGCAGKQPTAAPIVMETFEDAQAMFKQIREADPVEAQSRADELWLHLVEDRRVPLIFDTQVIFLYKGEAERVAWSGSFNKWGNPGLEGLRVGETDLWMAYLELPEASRVEYRIILNEDEWIVDPVNQTTAYSGLTGVNNVITLSGFTVTDESKKRDDVTPGTLSGELSIESDTLGYIVNYWVYTPAGYEELDKLPAMYVLDGNDFIDERMGSLPNVLDNLIADGRIEPILVVFINQRDPENPEFNRREEEFIIHPVEHAQFVAGELVPVIDAAYRTDPAPEKRVITGVSYGGLSAIYIAAAHPTVFQNLAAFSPSLWAIYNPEYLPNKEMQAGSTAMKPAFDVVTQCGPDTGFACPRLPVNLFLTQGWPDWDVGDLQPAVDDLERRGYPLDFHRVREGHTWDHWRGLSDEMLIYFFGTD